MKGLQIIITVTGGRDRLYGTCSEGSNWTQWDYQHESGDGECNICDKVTNSVWLCLDGGVEVCNECVVLLHPAYQ